MKKNISRVVIFIGCLLFTLSITAQKGWEIGGWLGTSVYYGDLNNRLSIQEPGLAGGFNVRRNFNTRTSTMVSLSYMRVGADDANSPNTFERNRNLSFHSSVFDLSAVMEFNFFDYIHDSSENYFTPYIFAGASVFRFNPKAELDGTTYTLRDFGTEGQPIGSEYGSFSGSLIIGGGWKWDISEKYSLNIHIRYQKVFTDYLDDVSRTYPDFRELGDNRGPTAVALSDRSLMDGIGIPGRQRGNSKDNDAIVTLGISIMKYFGKLECPRISDQ